LPNFKVAQGGARPRKKSAHAEGEEVEEEEEEEPKEPDNLEAYGSQGAKFLRECFRNMTTFPEFPSADYTTGTPDHSSIED
jgi:hypothetical protein